MIPSLLEKSIASAMLTSVPLEPLPLQSPAAVFEAGVRLDGRGLEECRSICEL